VCVQAVDGVLPGLLVDSHSRISGALQALSGCDSSSASFDVAVLEVVDTLEQHGRVRGAGCTCVLSGGSVGQHRIVECVCDQGGGRSWGLQGWQHLVCRHTF